MDGDGTVRLNNGRYPSFDLVGSQFLLGQFQAFVRGVCPHSTAAVRPHKNIFRIASSGWAALKVIEALYQDATVALERKAKAAGEMLSDEAARRAARLPLDPGHCVRPARPV